MTFSHLLNLWDDFWFKPQPPTAMALFRIAYGLIVLQFGLLLHPNLTAFFGEGAIVSLPSARMFAGAPQLNVLLLLPQNDSALQVFFAVFMAASVFLTLGLMSRLSAAIVFLAFVSLDFRDPFVFNSGDNFLRLGAFYLMLSHAGAAFSLDSAIKRALGQGDHPPVYAPWAQRLLQVQLVLIYCDTFWTKIVSEQWIDGTAVYYALRLQEFERLPVPHLLGSVVASKVLSWTTLLLELAGWTLIWVRDLRYPVLGALALFHLCLDWTLNIPQFQWIMLASMIAWIEPADIAAVGQQLSSRLRHRSGGVTEV